ncbi:TPA: hypothetical protein HA243_04555 [Candidatus Micrarchaeota archaeon]|nr:hypothetical protein [Candidatus Micrarchaeota archaeon]
MASETEVLVELGLTQNEAKLYLLMVKGGQMKASQLFLASGLQRRTVYDTLQQLEKKGLAGKAEVGGVQVFTPSPPSSLLSLLEEKRDSVEKILPSLSRIYESEGKTSVSVMYGLGGIKMVLEDVLSLRTDFCVYHGQLQLAEVLPKFFRIFNEKRSRLGIKARFMLLDIQTARERARSVPLADFKFIDPSTISAGVWWTYADRLVLFVMQKTPVVIFIKNADLATTFRKNFDNMFDSKTQIYRGDTGMKALLNMTLEHKETLFIGGSGQAPTRYSEYFEKIYTPAAMKKGHIWYNAAQRAILKTPAVKLPFHRIRVLPASMPWSPNVIWIFGNCVANVVWLPEPVAFLAEDPHIASAYRNYFRLLWRIAERR